MLRQLSRQDTLDKGLRSRASMALEPAAADARESPGSSAPDVEAGKRSNSSSEENMPFMDSEGKFGKRYKVCASTPLPHVVHCGNFGQQSVHWGVNVGDHNIFCGADGALMPNASPWCVQVHKVGSATNELQELKETASTLLGRGKKGCAT